MNIQSTFDSGVAGFNQATERAAESAREINQQQVTQAQPNEEVVEVEASAQQNTPVTESLINLRLAETQAQASAKVIETADNMLGSLIDTKV
jgi:flagellar hook protein FlgE